MNGTGTTRLLPADHGSSHTPPLLQQTEVRCPVCDKLKTGDNLYPQDFDIDCKGATGRCFRRYLRIHLPGENRIFAGTVLVNKYKPEPQDAGDDSWCATGSRRARATPPSPSL